MADMRCNREGCDTLLVMGELEEGNDKTTTIIIIITITKITILTTDIVIHHK